MNPECDPVERYRLLAKAAEYVFVSTQELQAEGNKGTQKVSFKTYFLKTVQRMRKAFDIYYSSKLAAQIAEGSYGIENMDAKYLAEDLIENESELFIIGEQQNVI